MSKMIEDFKAARRISTPIVGIATADQAATIVSLLQATPDDVPKIRWDRVRGMVGVNTAGATVIGEMFPPPANDDPTAPAVSAEVYARMMSVEPEDALSATLMTKTVEDAEDDYRPRSIAVMPPNTLLFFINAHRFLDDPKVMQAVWNLRDKFKADGRTLVLLGPSFTLPAELAHDVLLLDEPLPTPEQLREIVVQEFKNFELDVPAPKALEKAVDPLRGMAAFDASQAVAFCMHPRTGLNYRGLWERKRQMIGQTPGLSVWSGTERFADIGGVQNAKDFLLKALRGKRAPRGIVFIDELEKSLGGMNGDSSGTTQELVGAVLKYMENRNATGILMLGPAGSAKSALSKAAANEVDLLTTEFDLGGTKDKHVGESLVRMNHALKVISAVTDDQALFLATCNKIEVLPTELKRRFTFGTFFFDLPTAEERALIWPIYEKKFKLKGPRPVDTDWTGAEIKKCCDIADRLNIPLVEAATYIVPVAKSDAAGLERLRTEASGNYISASYPGTYHYAKAAASLTADHMLNGAGARAVSRAS